MQMDKLKEIEGFYNSLLNFAIFQSCDNILDIEWNCIIISLKKLTRDLVLISARGFSFQANT